MSRIIKNIFGINIKENTALENFKINLVITIIFLVCSVVNFYTYEVLINKVLERIADGYVYSGLFFLLISIVFGINTIINFIKSKR